MRSHTMFLLVLTVFTTRATNAQDMENKRAEKSKEWTKARPAFRNGLGVQKAIVTSFGDSASAYITQESGYFKTTLVSNKDSAHISTSRINTSDLTDEQSVSPEYLWLSGLFIDENNFFLFGSYCPIRFVLGCEFSFVFKTNDSGKSWENIAKTTSSLIWGLASIRLKCLIGKKG